VTVRKIDRGDNVGVEVTIRNEGGSDGTFTTKLILDGEVVAQKDVSITPNNDRQVTFDRQIEDRGTYSVKVNDKPAGEVEVTAPDLNQTATDASTDENDDESGSGPGAPGFGPVAAVLAIVLAAVIARRHN